MKIVVVIPTYNEAKNIGRLIDALSVEFKNIPNHEMRILVVEGNSPDGTAQVVRNKAVELPFVHLLMEEKKAGLGAAYVCGFRYAMNELKADIVVEMDADFQHDPKELPSLIKEIDNGYDYVIGSRFVKGGSIPKDWGLIRKLFSIFGNLTSKIILGIKGVNDFTTGYKVSRVKGFVDTIDLDNILSKGFAYKMDLLYKMHKAGAKIKEVPIQFQTRVEGDSKMEKNNPIDSLRVVIQLRLEDKDTQKFLKFCVVGFIGLITDASLANIFRLTILSSKNAPLLSGLIGMLVTFLLNNFWSFNRKMVIAWNDILSLVSIPFFNVVISSRFTFEPGTSFIYAVILGLSLYITLRRFNQRGNKILAFGRLFDCLIVIPLYIILYFVSSYVPVFFRSLIVGFAVSSFGNTFVVFNVAFFVGIVIGLIWNFTVYSKIIWRKKND